MTRIFTDHERNLRRLQMIRHRDVSSTSTSSNQQEHTGSDAKKYNTGPVMNLFLRVGNKNNSCIRVTQENSIEIPLQTSLPFILLPMVCAHYCTPYPK